jgi:hypothetical protein
MQLAELVFRHRKALVLCVRQLSAFESKLLA